MATRLTHADNRDIANEANQTPPRPEPTEFATSRAFPERMHAPSVILPLSERRDVVLRGTSMTIKFPLPRTAAKRLETVGSEAPGAPGLLLALDGVRATKAGLRDQVIYNLYINLPRTSASASANERAVDHYLGPISSFALSNQNGWRGTRIVIPLHPLIGGLRTKGSWSPDQLEIHFVQARRLESDVPLVLIESARIELGTKAQ